jgi:hypothetical protein
MDRERGRQSRVYWCGQPATKRDKTYEQAEQFTRLIDALDGDAAATQAFVRRDTAATQPATAVAPSDRSDQL